MYVHVYDVRPVYYYGTLEYVFNIYYGIPVHVYSVYRYGPIAAIAI